MSSSELRTVYTTKIDTLQVTRDHLAVNGKPDDLLKFAYQIISAARAAGAESPDPWRWAKAPIDYLSV